MKKISKQLKLETFLTCALYVFYFCWWYYFAYIYETTSKEFIFGLPRWFFYSCVLGLIVINLLVFIVIKLFFKEIDLD